TLLLFERELDVRLRWEFSFWRNRGCRLRDAEEVRALGLPKPYGRSAIKAIAFPHAKFFIYDTKISLDYVTGL
ncbi:MAG TPA: hypothetical protein VFJ46_03505, partial [Xanthobacteraceae bacterium]|nr:hypothetical protein [Xanthobacteraceae bacterium]